MKKILLSLAVLVSLGVTSCKKDRTCECTYSSNESGYTASVVDVTIIDAKKKDAKKMCVKTTSEYTSNGATYTQTTDCKLK